MDICLYLLTNSKDDVKKHHPYHLESIIATDSFFRTRHR